MPSSATTALTSPNKPGESLGSFALAFDAPPGPAKSERFETASAVVRMRESQCYLKSGGALTCTTCHNSHDIRHGSEAAAEYNQVCRQCHAQAFPKAVAARQHPAETNCIDCHMPKRRTFDIVHIVMTDHRIGRLKPAGDLLADRPEYHEDAATSDHGPVVAFYPDHPANTPMDALYLALAQVRDGANLAKGIPQFEKAIAAAKPASRAVLRISQRATHRRPDPASHPKLLAGPAF